MTQDAAVRACLRPGVRAYFQPIVDTMRGTVAGYESLARFSGPPHATPDRWFAVAHATGVGAELEARALRIALEARACLPPNCFLSVNVGPDALTSSPVAAMFADAGDLRGVVTRSPSRPRGCYDAWSPPCAGSRAGDAGGRRRGAGFASLKHITVRAGLLEGDLIRGYDIDETKAAVVEALGMFTSRLDAWLIAEGVETIAELDRLLSLRVPLVQGYGLGTPRPVMGAARPEAVALCRRRRSVATYGGLFDLAEAPASPRDEEPWSRSPLTRRSRGSLSSTSTATGRIVDRAAASVAAQRAPADGWATWPCASRPACRERPAPLRCAKRARLVGW